MNDQEAALMRDDRQHTDFFIYIKYTFLYSNDHAHRIIFKQVNTVDENASFTGVHVTLILLNFNSFFYMLLSEMSKEFVTNPNGWSSSRAVLPALKDRIRPLAIWP